jgi:soluble lytic murein transglycosylase-like protein
MSYNSYFSGLAAAKSSSDMQIRRTVSVSPSDYPVIFREELLQSARARKVDPRFLLAIMKQESSFRSGAKSPAGARGLLQLVLILRSSTAKRLAFQTFTQTICIDRP